MSFPQGRIKFAIFVGILVSTTIMTGFADPKSSDTKKGLSDLWLTLRDLPEDSELSQNEYNREELVLRKLADEFSAKDQFDPASIDKLLPYLMSQDWRLRCRALAVLIGISKPNVFAYEEYIIPLISDPNKAVRFYALKLLLLHGSRETRAVLGNFDKSKDEKFRKLVDEGIRKNALTRK